MALGHRWNLFLRASNARGEAFPGAKPVGEVGPTRLRPRDWLRQRRTAVGRIWQMFSLVLDGDDGALLGLGHASAPSSSAPPAGLLRSEPPSSHLGGTPDHALRFATFRTPLDGRAENVGLRLERVLRVFGRAAGGVRTTALAPRKPRPRRRCSWHKVRSRRCSTVFRASRYAVLSGKIGGARNRRVTRSGAVFVNHTAGRHTTATPPRLTP